MVKKPDFNVQGELGGRSEPRLGAPGSWQIMIIKDDTQLKPPHSLFGNLSSEMHDYVLGNEVKSAGSLFEGCRQLRTWPLSLRLSRIGRDE